MVDVVYRKSFVEASLRRTMTLGQQTPSHRRRKESGEEVTPSHSLPPETLLGLPTVILIP